MAVANGKQAVALREREGEALFGGRILIKADFLVGDEWMRLPAGSFVAAPMGVTHTFANRDGQRALLLNIHAPSTGFHERLRGF